MWFFFHRTLPVSKVFLSWAGRQNRGMLSLGFIGLNFCILWVDKSFQFGKRINIIIKDIKIINFWLSHISVSGSPDANNYAFLKRLNGTLYLNQPVQLRFFRNYFFTVQLNIIRNPVHLKLFFPDLRVWILRNSFRVLSGSL